MEEVRDVLCQACQEHRAIGWVHLHHTSIMLADGARNLWVLQQDRSRNLEESHLMDEDLVVRVVIALHYVDFLLYRLVDFLNLLGIAPHRDGIFVDVLDAASRYVQALDVHLSASEDGSNLIQDTSDVLSIDK